MLPFLKADQSQTLCKLFGPDTETGRQLRRMLAASQQQVAAKVNYPRIRPKKTPAECEPRPTSPLQIRYPKFRRKQTPKTIQSTSKGKRSATTITMLCEKQAVVDDIPIRISKDMSQEKRRLQESFPFAHAYILPSVVAGPRVAPPTSTEVASELHRKKPDEDDLIKDIIHEVTEAQKLLSGTSPDTSKKHGLENRIRHGLNDIKLLTCS